MKFSLASLLAYGLAVEAHAIFQVGDGMTCSIPADINAAYRKSRSTVKTRAS